ncbi:hypothetical protein [Streptomyces sp. PH10-H1]|uniref:RNA polymerase sigma factor n=1 Tax=Streptomyces sp. PH10-H1 TaxID=3046212 RepID=UPI0024B99EFA|nr:hypothetical protein [Streptomyces sp. PH10-H1]MDJ0347503.1 hypothetical protein [Streptomyces sp. PH10-H1]
MAIVAVQTRFVRPDAVQPGRKRCKREERARGALMAGNAADGGRLRPGEDVPLSVGESARLGELYAVHAGWMRGMVVNRLTRQGLSWAEAAELADDLSQNAWLRVARQGRAKLLAGPLDEVSERILLALNVKSAVGDHFALRRSHEVPADFEAPEFREVEAPSMLDAGAPGMSARCRELLDGLSPELRAVMVEFCYGVPQRAMADLLGSNLSTVNRLIKRAVAALGGGTGEPEVEPVALQSLPPGQRRALEGLGEEARAVLLLKLAGVSQTVIARRVGRCDATVSRLVRQYAHVLAVGSLATAA